MSFDKIPVWRCKICDKIYDARPSGSIGTLHAHIEAHKSWLKSLLPWKVADVDGFLMPNTQKIYVQVYDKEEKPTLV